MDLSQVRSRMQFVVSEVTSDISAIRTGRATPGLVEDVVCPAYGGTQKLKIKELASISAPDPQTIIIDPWDKSIIGDIKKGIEIANIGLTASIDGSIIRIILSPMTTEDREKYIRLLSVKIEAGRVMIRQIRADIMHDLKKSFEAKEISEDEKFGSEKDLQAETDTYINKIEELGAKKREELLSH